MSREKSEFLRRERDVCSALGEERTARTLAEERLSKKSAEATDLRRRCTKLETEAQEAQERVAPLEEKINSLRDALVCKSQERSAIPHKTIVASPYPSGLQPVPSPFDPAEKRIACMEKKSL